MYMYVIISFCSTGYCKYQSLLHGHSLTTLYIYMYIRGVWSQVLRGLHKLTNSHTFCKTQVLMALSGFTWATPNARVINCSSLGEVYMCVYVLCTITDWTPKQTGLAIMLKATSKYSSVSRTIANSHNIQYVGN